MAKGPDHLKRITIESRLLLLLEPFSGTEELMTVDEVLTQGGMSRELMIRRNNISRALSDLSSRGLVASMTKHIKGIQRRRRAYFLTVDGKKEAAVISRRIDHQVLIIKDQDGRIVEWSFDRSRKEISSLLHRDVSRFELISLSMNDDRIDLNSLCRVNGKLHHPNTPVVKEFHGRIAEMEILLSSIHDRKPFISIIGIAGQGKTTLGSRAISLSGKRAAWIDLDPWMSPDILVDEIELFLSGPDRSSYTSMRDLFPRMRRISKKMAELDSVLVLDDVHRCGGAMMDALSGLVHLSRKEGWTIIFLSRTRPSVYTTTEAKTSDSILEMELSGLDRKASYDLMRGRGVAEDGLETIFDKTSGHPLAINLCALSIDADPAEISASIRNFIEDKVLSEISETERMVIEQLSVMDIPIDISTLASLTGSKKEVTRKLISKLLVRIYPDGKVDLHDSIKEGVEGSLTEKRARSLNSIARDHHRSRSSDMDMVQFLLLSDSINDDVTVINGLLDHGEYLVGRGYITIADLVLKVDREELDGSDRVRFEVLCYDSSLALGDEGSAMEHLKFAASKAESLTRSSKDRYSLELTTMVLNRLAERALREGLYNDVIDKLRKGMVIARNSGAKDQEGRLLSNIGSAYMDLGEPTIALRYFDDSRKMFHEVGDMRGEAISLLNSGQAYSMNMELSMSLRQYLECIKLAKRFDLGRILSQANFRVARLYVFVEEQKNSTPFFTEAAIGYVKVGDIDLSLVIIIEMAKVSFASGSLSELKRTIDRMKKVLSGSGWTYLKHRLGWDGYRNDSDQVLLQTLSMSLDGDKVPFSMMKNIFLHGPVRHGGKGMRIRKELMVMILTRENAPRRYENERVINSIFTDV